ncbi:ABC transporter permease [Tenacibaculum sp. SG-28]|uniref:ABC transporter permease n=1 Tax=Tenacibaculum sp. SG-28 TaxID=754426 RepID=UPI000CF57994|nr:ABC transporter permease [Tenacibaculum sp. SG-28]PQJ23434.1 multidrug ABC transporter permease [Tenacibaculum sp. SG-28]
MWKIFYVFVKKEWCHILRDKRTLLILFGIPLVQVLLFGYAVTTEFKNAHIAILDHARNTNSQRLISHVQSSGNFVVQDLLQHENQIEDGFKDGTIQLVLVIPKEFQQHQSGSSIIPLQLIADGSDPNKASTLVQYMSAMLQKFDFFTASSDAPFVIQIEERMLYNPQLISAYNFIPGTISFILLIISAMLTSLTIAREKEIGTMEILLVSPLPPIVIILGKVAPYAILSFIDAIVILLVGHFVFEVPVNGSIILLLSCCFLYVLTALTLGILISIKSKTQQQAMMGSMMGLMLPAMILSGFVFPVASMHPILQVISKIIPATHFINILKGVMLRGVGLVSIGFEIVILLITTLILLLITWKSFKIRLE